MGYELWFGKFKGISLEEIALGKNAPGGGGKSEGYYYFHQLAKGDPKYFRMFQDSERAMQKWKEIHYKLNRFVVAGDLENCPICHVRPSTTMSIAGSGQYGYSVSPAYICCNDANCRTALTSMPSGPVQIYNIGFDTMLNFGWSSGGRKADQEHVARVLRELAGWNQRLTEENATNFINALRVRA